MKSLFVMASAALILALSSVGHATAAPPLQLPWPSGVQYGINAGNTYGCEYHTGSSYYAIDFALGFQNSVTAVARGTVSEFNNVSDIRGNWAEIDHGAGYKTRYLHLDSWIPGIYIGMPLAQGQVLGYAGGSGNVAVHLHFDMKLNGNAFKAEPMSGVAEFGWWGFSVESGIGGAGCSDAGPGCTPTTCGNIHDPSPTWTSAPPHSNFQTRIAAVVTGQPATDGNWAFAVGDFDRGGQLDMIGILKHGANNHVEVHIRSGESNFQTSVLDVSTDMSGIVDAQWQFEVGDYNSDGYPDLFAIRKYGASGQTKTEAHIYSGASNFQTALLHTATSIALTDSD